MGTSKTYSLPRVVTDALGGYADTERVDRRDPGSRHTGAVTQRGRRADGRQRGRRTLVGLLAIGFVLAVVASPAAATWSIVATDPDGGEVGVAIASCVPGDVLGDPEGPLVPVVIQPAVGAAVTQGQLNLDAPERIRQLTRAGSSPTAIIEGLVTEDFDEVAEVRQHAVVSLQEGPAAFTGAETTDAALDAQGRNVSVQGNLLVADTVVTDSLTRFEAETEAGAALAGALAAALLAGAEAGGDRRCGDQGALFAQVVVAGPTDTAAEPTVLVTVLVDPDSGDDPVVELVAALERGERGLVDRRGDGSSAGLVVRTLALVLGVAMLGLGAWVMVRGLGSVKARR